MRLGNSKNWGNRHPKQKQRPWKASRRRRVSPRSCDTLTTNRAGSSSNLAVSVGPRSRLGHWTVTESSLAHATVFHFCSNLKSNQP